MDLKGLLTSEQASGVFFSLTYLQIGSIWDLRRKQYAAK